MRQFSLAILFFFSFTMSAFAQQTSDPITMEQAVEIAKKYAADERSISPDELNYNISAFEVNGKWNITFDPKPDDQGLIMIGDDFIITISNDGKVTDVIEGH